MRYTQGAARLCQRPNFQRFLAWLTNQAVQDANQAAVALRTQCQIQSRRELNTNPEAGKRYQQLIRQFNDWMNKKDPTNDY